MTFFAKKNFARGSLASGITAGATQVTLTAGHSLPTTGSFRAIIWDVINYPYPPNDANMEIITAVLSSGDIYDITRAQEGTSASAHSANNRMALEITAGQIQELEVVDAVAGTGSLRTLGTGAQQACGGADSRLSDARNPTGTAGGSLAGTYPNPTIAANIVGTGTLKTATGVTSGTGTEDITLNDYSFFPSITASDSGNLYRVDSFSAADPGTTVGRFRITMLAGAGGRTVRWRYMTASDKPTVWLRHDVVGNILSVWMADDPVVDEDGKEYPGLEAIDPGHSVIKLPLSELNILLEGVPENIKALGRAKSSRPEVEPFRIVWKAFKNPAEELMKLCRLIPGTQKLMLKGE